MSNKLTVDQAGEISDAMRFRQSHFSDEPLETSIIVVLLNWGDKYKSVVCTAGEWSGVKADLGLGEGLPHCPNGHPLFETGGGKQLALVDVEVPDESA